MPDNQPGLLERLLRLREPLACVFIVVFATRMVLTVVDVIARAKVDHVGLAMRGAGMGFLLECFLMVVVVGVCSVIDPPTRQARVIAIVAAVVTTVTLVVGLVFMIGSLTVPGDTSLGRVLEFIGGIMDVALKAVAAWLLWQMPRRLLRGSEPPRIESRVEWPQPPGQSEESRLPEKAEEASPTAGARWNSAKDAAQGGKAQWAEGGQGPQPQAPEDLWKRRS